MCDNPGTTVCFELRFSSIYISLSWQHYYTFVPVSTGMWLGTSFHLVLVAVVLGCSKALLSSRWAILPFYSNGLRKCSSYLVRASFLEFFCLNKYSQVKGPGFR